MTNHLSYSHWLQENISNSTKPVEKKDKTRTKLKIAASSLLNFTPYQELHIHEICKKADVGAGTFYRYFKGKKELTEEILEELIQHFFRLMSAAGKENQKNSMFDLFTQANLSFFRFADANHGLFRCLLHANAEEYQLGNIFENSTSSWAVRVTQAILKNHITATENAKVNSQLNEACTLTIVHCLASMLDDLAARLTFRNDQTLKTLFEENDLNDVKSAKFLAVLWHRIIFGCDPEGHTAAEFFKLSNLKNKKL